MGGADFLPMVTVQLAVFNEVNVVERLHGPCGAGWTGPRTSWRSRCWTTPPTTPSRWPRPSATSTAALGFDIAYLHRTDRTGYKAGALQNGLKTAKGEFVAMFDADFLPTVDFLRQARAPFRRRQDRLRPGLLGPPEPRLLPADPGPGHPAGRPLRLRAHRPAPLQRLLQFLRHRRHVAGERHRRRRAAGSTTPSPRTPTSATGPSSRAGGGST